MGKKFEYSEPRTDNLKQGRTVPTPIGSEVNMYSPHLGIRNSEILPQVYLTSPVTATCPHPLVTLDKSIL